MSNKRRPTHPGVVLRDTVIPASRLSISDFADRLLISRQTLHRILSERSGISMEMALRLGALCGNGEMLWIRMQEAFDMWQAKQKMATTLPLISPL